MGDFSLFPEAASVLAPQVDGLFWFLVALCGGVLLTVACLVLFFVARYRKGSPADRSGRTTGSLRVEWGWTAALLAIFLFVFAWAAQLNVVQSVAPPQALTINAIGKQWMWKFQHPDGQREIDELHVPLGQAVRLVLTSQDVIHSFYVPAFRIKQDVVPGRYSSVWFEATKPGTYHLFCAEYCGTSHSRMRGRVTVLEPAEYERWLRRAEVGPRLAEQGAQLFRSYGCSGCHGLNSTVRAPSFVGIYGKPVPLMAGGTKIVDEAYIRDSILLPEKDVVAGYEPIMPSFKGQIEEGDILKLIAYIRSLADDDRGSP